MFGLLLLIVAGSARQDIFETEWVTLLIAVVGRVCPRCRRTFPGSLGWITQSTLFLHSLDSTVTDGWAKHHEPVAKIRTLYISMILSLTGLVSLFAFWISPETQCHNCVTSVVSMQLTATQIIQCTTQHNWLMFAENWLLCRFVCFF